ncbi:MAG: hypothetical protein KKD77_22220 [Gammaproteobacteria bacterium]|nr:hypothetical protein [Gammaproteobacteria bacterium]
MKQIVIMGSGPSLTRFKWHGSHGKMIDTFGLKNQYKAYAHWGWYPTYYACLDRVSYSQNREQILKMVTDPGILTKKFFLYEPVNYDRVVPIRWTRPRYDFSLDLQNLGDGANTAVNAAQIACCLGYNKIYLIGIDLSWPAYFDPNYHVPGEEHQHPGVEINHVEAWHKFDKWTKKKGIHVALLAENKQLPFRMEKLKW